MKVEFLNEELTEALLTRGWWLWKEQARVSRHVKTTTTRKGKERKEIEWFYTDTGDLYLDTDWFGEVKWGSDSLPETERQKTLVARRPKKSPVSPPSPWKPAGTRMLGADEHPLSLPTARVVKE